MTAVDSGESVPINGIFLPGSTYYKAPPYPAYNVPAAKKLIAKVPAAQRKFTLTYVAGDPAVATAVALFQNMLSKVGVTVTTNGVTQGTLIGDAIFGAYQCMTWAQFGGVSPDLNHPWFSVRPPKGGTWLNFARNQDTKIESYMLAGMAATSATARKNAWASVNIASTRTCRTCGPTASYSAWPPTRTCRRGRRSRTRPGTRCSGRTRPCSSSRRPGSPSHHRRTAVAAAPSGAPPRGR